MGAAAYRRGSRAISARIDRELGERRYVCGGTYRNGPDKAYARCDRCGRVDYEKYEGDKCSWPPRPRDNPSDPYGDPSVGDTVQFRWEPGTGGVIQRESRGQSWVMTSRGLREVPTDALRKVRPEHEARTRHSAGRLDNPAGGGAVALAALAVAGVAWLLLRPKEAAAATSPAAFANDLELPSLVPSTTPTATPDPAKITPGPALPQLNCAGKVFVTYKFKDAPPVVNVFRRLTTWQQGLTPDQGQSFEERNWALSGTTSFFNIGVLDAQGWLNTTTFENRHKDAQILYVTKRYLAEAWVETTNGWCLAATDTNYEPWV